MSRRLRLLLWPAGAALGIAAEASYYGLGDARHWVPDLAAGWALIGCGLIAWSRRPRNASGPLLVAAGAAWFAANFSDQLVYLHRGPLLQLVLTYPRGRPRGRVELAAVAVGYGAAVVKPLWDSDTVTIALALAIAVTAVTRQLVRGELERAARVPGTAAALAFAAVLGGSAVARLAAASASDVQESTLLAYQLTLCAIAVGLLLGLDRAERARATVADLVVDLGDQPGTLRAALASALGDPSLEIGYWVPAARAYVDAEGRPVRLPAPDAGRHVTKLERRGAPVAALVHDPAVLDAPALVDALATAARLAAANAELQADVRAQVEEIDASRGRLVRAGDEERRHLERRLRAGAQQRLEALRLALERSRTRAGAGDSATRIAEAQDQLERTLAELRELGAGLHPAALTEHGLQGALTSLAARFPFAVDVSAPAERLPREVEATAYFVCSEALANVAKHSHASRVTIAVERRGESLNMRVSDDGRGGADAARGSGVRGLVDRVEALGGRLELASPAGAGTSVLATIPLRTATPSGEQ